MTEIVTYVITNGESVKIGVTRNLPNRLSTLQCSSPKKLGVLVVIPGDHEDKLHKKFHRDREIGEWFTLSESMKQFIMQQQAALYLEWLDKNSHQAVVFKPTPTIAYDDLEESVKAFIDALPIRGNRRKYFATSALWDHLGIDKEMRERSGSIRIANIMRRFDFQRTRVRVNDHIEVGYVSNYQQSSPSITST